jgi:biopolymer transport protein ExbB
MIERIIQLFLAGGWVMYPLLVMSLLSLTLIFERFVFWTFSNQRLGVNRFKSYLVVFASNQVSKAMKDAASDPTLEGELVRSALESKTTNEAILIGYVESMRLLSGIIAAAPLMGILGTVTGIISSFDLLGEAAAVSDPALVAGGIAEALYTTAFGLTIALVTLFPTIYFKSRSQRVLGRLETLAGVIIDAQEHQTQSHDPNLEK